MGCDVHKPFANNKKSIKSDNVICEYNMDKLFQIKSMLEYEKSIQLRLAEVCSPLGLLGISYFSYAKLCKDQQFFRIGNNGAYNKLYAELELFNHPQAFRGLACADIFCRESETKLFFWNAGDNVLSHLRISVDVWNGVTIYCTNKEYIEIWAFGGTPQDTQLPNFIVNNMDVINRFMMYFKDKAKDIIDISDRFKTIEVPFHSACHKSYETDLKALDEFIQRISPNKYYISKGAHEFSLTLREMECLIHKNDGLTAKEIARRLDISFRTVESYFNNIKTKSGLENINQILAACRKEGLF